MGELSNCLLDPFFSFRIADSAAYIVWKVKNFSTLRLNSYNSHEFKFENTVWHLKLCPGDDSGMVDLYLQPSSPFLFELKYRFFCKSESGEDLHTIEFKTDFTDGRGYGCEDFLNRLETLDEKFGNLIPDDILTICCEIESVANSEAQKETSTGQEENPPSVPISPETDSFLTKFRETFDSGRFSDVVLRVGEETIPAHKVILSTHSEVFQGMFESNMKESRDNTVDLIDIDITVAKAMLLYTYTRQVEKLSAEKTLKLYVAADKYMLTELKEKCREYLSNNLSSENVGDVFEIASLHSDNIMSKAAQKFFANNVKSILNSKEWKEFSAHNPFSSVELLSFAITSNVFF